MSTACGGGGGGNKTPDAAPLMFQGEYVDWDSSAAAFCGIDMASYNAAGSSATTPTPPNGRLMQTMPVGVTQIDLMPPDMPSQCAPGSGVYDNPGVIAIDAALVTAQVTYSTRSFTTDRRASLFTALGLTYDPTKAMVLINVQGTATNPVIGASHDPPAAYDGTTWGSGATGVYVFFPNVDTTTSNTLLTATGYAGSAEIPIAAATFTYAAVSSM
jgi:hypothetical protein